MSNMITVVLWLRAQADYKVICYCRHTLQGCVLDYKQTTHTIYV